MIKNFLEFHGSLGALSRRQIGLTPHGGKLTDREAAEAVGISPSQAAHVKRKPRVKEYMASHRASVRAGLVPHEVDALAEFNIGREQILAKWWQFASIDPGEDRLQHEQPEKQGS